MNYSDDSLTLLLLCSHLSLPKESDLAPLTTREWNPLAHKLQAATLRPGDLLGMSAHDLGAQLSYSADESSRLSRLLERRGALAIELQRLESLGIRPITRADDHYPEKLHQRLNEAAPVVIFYAGESALLGQPGIAVVGSRNLDHAGEECARFVGNACGLSGLVLYSGGARGVDSISMEAALESRGCAAGLLADSLERAIRPPGVRDALKRGDLCLATPYSPNAGFSVGAAMGRNRLIYTLADYAIVVASDAGKGGTWAGATETLKNGWVPVFVLDHPDMPAGNRQLMQKGALAFPHPFPEHYSKLRSWLEGQASTVRPKPRQLGLM